MSLLEELAKKQGFADEKEMNQLVASVNLSTPVRQTAFQHWKEVDGSKDGLLKVINGTYMHYRYEDAPPTTSRIIGFIEVGLKPEAANSQYALHILIQRLELAEAENKRLHKTLEPLATAYTDYMEYWKTSDYDNDFIDYMLSFRGGAAEVSEWGSNAVEALKK